MLVANNVYVIIAPIRSLRFIYQTAGLYDIENIFRIFKS